jgi:hypothetical protein
VSADQTVTYQALDWSFDSDSSAVAAVRASLHGWRAAPSP